MLQVTKITSLQYQCTKIPNVPKYTQNIKSAMHIFYFSVHWGTIWFTTTIYNARHDDILDVQHLADTFVVKSLSDVAPLKEAAKSYCIKVPHIIQYNFSNTIIDVGKKVPGYEEIPPPVLNVFLKYGNKYIVRDCCQILLLIFSKFSNVTFLGGNIYQGLFYSLIACLSTCSDLF